MTNEYNPDWVSPPGDTIRDILEECGWDFDDLSKLVGYDCSGLSNGQMVIDKQVAEDLALALGSSASFWLRREEFFRGARR